MESVALAVGWGLVVGGGWSLPGVVVGQCDQVHGVVSLWCSLFKGPLLCGWWAGAPRSRRPPLTQLLLIGGRVRLTELVYQREDALYGRLDIANASSCK